MAAPTPANMDTCDPKCRCPGGPYANQAYLCSDPCEGQGTGCTFDCENGCNCGCSGETTAEIRWKVSFATYSANCTPATKLCSDFGNTQYSRQVSYVEGTEIQFTTVPTGAVGGCSGTENTAAAITKVACVNGSKAFVTESIGAPGCSVNTSAGAIATVYDEEVVY